MQSLDWKVLVYKIVNGYLVEWQKELDDGWVRTEREHCEDIHDLKNFLDMHFAEYDSQQS